MKPRVRVRERSHAPGDIKAQAVGAFVWVGSLRFANLAISQAFTLVLLRLLHPGDYGLLAMAGVLTALLDIVADMGLARSLVQRREIDEEYASTAFWSNLTVGVLLCVIVVALAQPIATFYGNPKVRTVLSVLALRFVFAGLTATQFAVLWRDLRARALATRTTLSVVSGGIVGIALGLAHAGVWALVGQSLTTVLSQALLLWIISPWRPTRRFSWTKFKDLWNFGSRLIGARIFRFVVVHADNFLIGKWLGATALGYYAFGYAILRLFIDLSQITTQVSFATFSRLQDDGAALRRAFLKINRHITLFILPALVGLFLIAPDVILIAFGSKWTPALPVLRILLIAAMLHTFTSLWQSLFQALGRADLVFKWSFAAACVYVPAFAVGLRWGILGVAVAYTASTFLLMPAQLSIVRRMLNFTLTEYVRGIQPFVVTSILMGSVVLTFQIWAVRVGMAPWSRSILAILIGGAVYGGVLAVTQRDLLVDLWATVRGIRGRGTRRARLAQPAG